MGTITLQVPTSGLPNSTEDPKITSNFAALQTLLNGNLDASNINVGSALALPSGRASGGTQYASLFNSTINLGQLGHGTATFASNGITYSTSTGFFTVPEAGVYCCGGSVNLALNAASQTGFAYVQLMSLHNGSNYGAGPAYGVPTNAIAPFLGLTVTDQIQCVIGDTLGLVLAGASLSNSVAVQDYTFNVFRSA